MSRSRVFSFLASDSVLPGANQTLRNSRIARGFSFSMWFGFFADYLNCLKFHDVYPVILMLLADLPKVLFFCDPFALKRLRKCILARVSASCSSYGRLKRPSVKRKGNRKNTTNFWSGLTRLTKFLRSSTNLSATETKNTRWEWLIHNTQSEIKTTSAIKV